MQKRKKNTKQRDADLPEEITINILARLPLQSIIRFKLVCRGWKLLTESAFFDNLYQRNSNSQWSILHGNYKWLDSSLEEVKLDLPHESPHTTTYVLSFASFFAQNKNKKIKEITVVACADGLVLLRLKPDDEDTMIRYYIGNPVLAQWIQLPPPPSPPRWTLAYGDFRDSGLVTRMQNGTLLAYKVVRIDTKALCLGFSRTWSFEIFSSVTGEWSVEQVSCPGRGVSMLNTSNPVSLNGKLHWLDNDRRIIVHDFFSDDDAQVRAISLPARMPGSRSHWFERRCHIGCCSSPCGKMICTTSEGYFVLIDAGLIDEVKSYNVRVWRLIKNSDSWNWEKAWEINMASVGLGSKCVPMAINCFDIDIIYLWDLKRNCFLACNLRAHTNSCGTRKDGTAYKDDKGFLAFLIQKYHATSKDGAVYKEDIICFEPRSCLSQFVPSLQLVPNIGGTQR